MTVRPVPPSQASGYGDAAVAPHHLSALAALEIMANGGNAVDGALAANAVQGVVAPETCGVGGDLFALVHQPGQAVPVVLNASGRAGRRADAEALRADGFSTIPYTHPEAVTVPGCVEGWSALAERFGRLPLATLLGPAIHYATEGFAVSVELALTLDRLAEDLVNQDAAAGLYPDGRVPAPGDIVMRPDLASTLGVIASGGRRAFYESHPGESISKATGGRITMDDLAEIRSDWVQPLAVDVFGSTGWTVPPNSQGYLTLAAAWLFERLDPPTDPDHPDFFHLLIEAYRAVAWELGDLVADPDFAPLPPEELLSHDRLSSRLAKINRASAAVWPAATAPPGGTAYLCVVDREGMGVSIIQSNYTGFGGGIGVQGGGFFLHNRGAGFNLQPGHPNELAPGKRPLHTLSPTLWTRDGRLELLLGTRGGSYQPQILVQVAAHLLHRSLTPAEAQARPRWVIDHQPERVRLEATAGAGTAQALTEKGHEVDLALEYEPGWGPVSLIRVAESGLRTAAADPRVPTALAAIR
ncbi:MAG: gamma-glutamyltransferase [Acidimicrobiia bacterium]|nr:gamma-glutamyltransferase [Acidimicrobiia bacterium]